MSAVPGNRDRVCAAAPPTSPVHHVPPVSPMESLPSPPLTPSATEPPVIVKASFSLPRSTAPPIAPASSRTDIAPTYRGPNRPSCALRQPYQRRYHWKRRPRPRRRLNGDVVIAILAETDPPMSAVQKPPGSCRHPPHRGHHCHRAAVRPGVVAPAAYVSETERQSLSGHRFRCRGRRTANRAGADQHRVRARILKDRTESMRRLEQPDHARPRRHRHRRSIRAAGHGDIVVPVFAVDPPMSAAPGYRDGIGAAPPACRSRCRRRLGDQHVVAGAAHAGVECDGAAGPCGVSFSVPRVDPAADQRTPSIVTSIDHRRSRRRRCSPFRAPLMASSPSSPAAEPPIVPPERSKVSLPAPPLPPPASGATGHGVKVVAIAQRHQNPHRAHRDADGSRCPTLSPASAPPPVTTEPSTEPLGNRDRVVALRRPSGIVGQDRAADRAAVDHHIVIACAAAGVTPETEPPENVMVSLPSVP